MLLGEEARFGCARSASPWAEKYGNQFVFRWSLDYDKDGQNDIDLAKKDHDGNIIRKSDGSIDYEYQRGYCRAIPIIS